jgi:hypothetical protein
MTVSILKRLFRAGVEAVEPDSSGFSAEGGIRPGVYAGFGRWRRPFLSTQVAMSAAFTRLPRWQSDETSPVNRADKWW